MGVIAELKRSPRLGLALGGGAARGLAHLGVLSVLEEEGLAPDTIGGVSFGAFVGAVYAASGSAELARESFDTFLNHETFKESRLHFFIEESTVDAQGGFFAAFQSMMKRGLFYTATTRREGYLSHEEFSVLIKGVLPEQDLRSLKIPCFAVAAELHTGQEIVLEQGPAQESVMASCAIPGVMPPVLLDGRLLIDGGCVRKLPGDHLRARGADVVVGVDVSTFPKLDPVQDVRGSDVLLRAYAIKDERLRHYGRRECDVLLKVDVEEVHWADFGRMEDCVQAGRREAERHLPEIRKFMEAAASPAGRIRRLRGR